MSQLSMLPPIVHDDPGDEGDPNADLIGYEWSWSHDPESHVFRVTETGATSEYVNVDQFDALGNLVQQTCRPAALVRKQKREEAE